MTTLTDDLSAAVNQFLTPLRMGDGYSEQSVQRLCHGIRSFNHAYADSDLLPKTSVSIFVDLSPSIEGCMSLYNEEDQKKILDAAITIVDVILGGL